MNKLEQYLNEKEYILKKKLFLYNNDYKLINNVNCIVKQFIIDKNLIISGGLAIDYALKLKGSYIYSDIDSPDYDCKSSNSVDDAYDLGELLHNNNFENVKVIRAKHNETMRVRVNLITVCDITYIPEDYYCRFKKLKFDNLNILHPDIQRIDLHIAFCFPFKNFPTEDIFYRWKKDIERFNLYEKYYPIEHIDIKYNIKEYDFNIPKELDGKDFAFNGFVVYALLSNEIKKFVNADMIDFPILNISINNKTKKCKIEMPIDDKLILVTNTKNINLFNNDSLYSTILNIIPLSCHLDNSVIYFIDMLSIVNIDEINIVNIQYLLVYFLFNYNFSNDIENKNLYKNFYFYTLKMIEIAERIDNNSFNKDMFMLSLKYLGDEPPYILPNLQDPTLPINYNPYKLGTRPSFDYSNLKLSGKKIN